MTTEPQFPDMPKTSAGATVLAVGTDLVHIPDFETQLDQPGTVFAQQAFTARELRDTHRRAQEKGSRPAQHLAARWAAKEAFIKAWSQALNTRAGGASAPVIVPDDVDWSDIEVVTDRWGRPSLRLRGAIARAVETSLGEGSGRPGAWPVSLTHDGDWAAAIVLAVTSP